MTYRFATRIDLINNLSIVIRYNIGDLDNQPDWTSEKVRAHLPDSLKDYSDDVYTALSNCISSHLHLEAQKHVRIAELAAAIVKDLKDENENVMLVALAISLLRGLLTEYGDAAVLAGWSKFLRLCEAYLEQR